MLDKPCTPHRIRERAQSVSCDRASAPPRKPPSTRRERADFPAIDSARTVGARRNPARGVGSKPRAALTRSHIRDGLIPDSRPRQTAQERRCDGRRSGLGSQPSRSSCEVSTRGSVFASSFSSRARTVRQVGRRGSKIGRQGPGFGAEVTVRHDASRSAHSRSSLADPGEVSEVSTTLGTEIDVSFTHRG